MLLIFTTNGAWQLASIRDIDFFLIQHIVQGD